MSLDNELDSLASEIDPYDPFAAKRLRSLREAVSPTGNPAGWAGIDVFHAVNPAATASHVRERLSENTGHGKLERMRNILVLTPILFTWLGLTYAATGYRTAIRADHT